MSISPTGRYRVFRSPGFRGNPTTLHRVDRFPADAELLAHSRRQETIDNGYYQAGGEPDLYQLRFFSHDGEIRLCGHGLLAAAYHLLGDNPRDLRLETPGYRHECREEGGQPRVSLPVYEAEAEGEPLLDSQLRQAGIAAAELYRFPFRVWVARSDSVTDILLFRPEAFDWQALAPLQPGALLLTAPQAQGGYAFRYFAPWYGKDEDSATGSAHCYLASLWLKADGEESRARQLSPAGEALMELCREGDRVWLGGRVGH